MKYSVGSKVVPVSKKVKGYELTDIANESHWSRAIRKGQNFLYVSGYHVTEYGQEVYKLSDTVEKGGNYYLESDVKMYNGYNATENAIKFLNDLEDLKKAYDKFPTTNAFRSSGDYKPLTVLYLKSLNKYCVITRVFDKNEKTNLEVVGFFVTKGKYELDTPSYCSMKYFKDEYDIVSNDAVTFLKDLFTKDLEAEKKKKEINAVIDDLKKRLDEATNKLNELNK